MPSPWSMLSNWCLIGEIEGPCSGGDVFILEETSGRERARRFVSFPRGSWVCVTAFGVLKWLFVGEHRAQHGRATRSEWALTIRGMVAVGFVRSLSHVPSNASRLFVDGSAYTVHSYS